MKSKIPFLWPLSIVGITGVIFSILFAVFLLPDLQIGSSAITSQVINAAEVSETVMQLKIPEIGLNAPVESVGVTSHGAMDVPQGMSNVAWFNLGPLPGERGSAVIDGHFGAKDGIPTVFDNLHKLQKGDRIH